MPFSTRVSCLCAVILLTVSLAVADQPPADARLPMSRLAPAKIMPNLCVVKYRVSTASPECQAFFDQGLAFYYSYVWMEATRSFETAARYDPDCAMAWWGLSRALDGWSKKNGDEALRKAQQLLPRASDREQMLITARLQDKGLIGGLSGDARRKAARKTLDALLALYDDDEEAWYNRAQLADDRDASVPYYKALLRVNPLHPGANHELVHYYENSRRPGLGWKHAEQYIASSPGIPHAFHMQAHLATRLGFWDKTSDRSARAIELQRAYHKEMNIKPTLDWQFPHHLEILTLSLIHDGRFREARAIKEEAWKNGYRQWKPWFRLHLAERDWDAAEKVVEQLRKSDKTEASYFAALLYLKKGDLARATAEVEVLQLACQKTKSPTNESRLWETQGLLMCQSEGSEAGVKLLAKAVERTKDNYQHHAWGNGAYYMEIWGIGALHAGKADVAEEAFLEALAHDPGSVRAALGLEVLCERQGRTEEATRYAALARRCWRRADPNCLETELASLREAVASPGETKDIKDKKDTPQDSSRAGSEGKR